ncbi:unnamed protein product, partial [Didymodactylos carnosus]
QTGQLSNCLIVGEAIYDDNCCVITLSQQKMDGLKLSHHALVLLKGKMHRETERLVLADGTCPNDHIRMNCVFRNNLHITSADVVFVQVLLSAPE